MINIDGQNKEFMIEAEVIYNYGEVMCRSYGCNRKQAERNASVAGLYWIEENFKEN